MFEGDFAVQVAFLGSGVAADLVGEDVSEDLAEPGHELGLGAAPEFGEVSAGFEEGLLDDVGGVELGLEAVVDAEAGEDAEPGFEGGEGLSASGGIGVEEGFEAWRGGG